MNILPKKSWHVRSKKNIERVRRDEEKAAEEEKEIQRRIALAEQEARTDLLRDRSRKRQHHEIEGASTSAIAEVEGQASSALGGQLVKRSVDISLNQGGHINFFKDIEEGLRREGKNKEHEAEKAAEKEKWEKNIGLLTYLGQSAIESQNDKPWYVKKTETQIEKKASHYDIKQAKREDLDKKLKESMDPLKDMHRHLEKHHKHRHHSKEKHKHNKQDKYRQPPSAQQTKPKAPKSIEELRAERLRRESAEKQKIAAVMAKARGENPASSAEDDHISDADRDRSRGYNSRYNPDFVKPIPHRRR